MRSTLAAVLLLCGCLDFEALYGGSTPADLSASGSLDLVGSSADLSTSVDFAVPDLSPAFYWVSTFSGGAKPLRGISGAGAAIYAVGDSGALIQSANSGGTWTAPNTGTGTNFASVWASAAGDAWIVGNGGKVYSYDGATLGSTSMAPNQGYAAVFGVSAQQVIAVGDDQNIGGQFRMMNKWQSTTHNLGARQHGMWGMSNRLWSFGENNTGGYYDITTSAWTAQPIAAAKAGIPFNAGWGSSATDVWAVGAEGNISHFVAAPPFQVVSSGTTVNLNGIWGLGPSNIWAVGDAGTIVHYDGTSWQKWTKIKDIASNESLQAIWGNATNLWTVSDKGNIYRYQ